MRAIAIALLALLPAAPAFAAPPESRHLEELTWTEVRDRIRSGSTTVLVPIGGTEQNGAHMALGKHNVRVKVLAERIAGRLGNALVAPVLAYVPEGSIDPPTGHMRFPGTITVPAAVFESTLESVSRGFRRHGFRDVVFLGDSGGYQESLRAVAKRLNREWSATPARAHAIDEYYRAAGITEHAGAADTSLTLAIDPRLVRADRLHSAGKPSEGVQGNPANAGAEEGRAAAERIVARTAEAIGKAIARR